MERINCSSASEALIKALENVDGMKNVIILYTRESDENSEDQIHGYYTNHDLKTRDANWMLDTLKQYFLSFVTAREQ